MPIPKPMAKAKANANTSTNTYINSNNDNDNDMSVCSYSLSDLYKTGFNKENELRDPFSLLIVFSSCSFFLINYFWCFILSHLFLGEDACRRLENRSGLSFL